jgi:hypothetical protein
MLEPNAEVKEKLEEIEGKIDCCMVLLATLVSADGFSYDMTNVPDNVVEAFMVAERTASRLSDAVIARHLEQKAPRPAQVVQMDTPSTHTEALAI